MDNVPTNEENVVAMTEEEEINELASMLASIGIDEEDEAVLDMLYAGVAILTKSKRIQANTMISSIYSGLVAAAFLFEILYLKK
jgi:hypothetical protein